MLVVLAIFILLASVILANNSRFNNHIVLENLAHDIALSVRQAQIYGIAVQRYSSGQFNVAYGVHFDASAGNDKNYLLFADVNLDHIYQAGESLIATTLSGGYSISDVCLTPYGIGATETCVSGGLPSVTDITFTRPEPDAKIYNSSHPELSQRVRIIVLSPKGERLAIVVEGSGQISVQLAP